MKIGSENQVLKFESQMWKKQSRVELKVYE
jgi:hypothetical protein